MAAVDSIKDADCQPAVLQREFIDGVDIEFIGSPEAMLLRNNSTVWSGHARARSLICPIGLPGPTREKTFLGATLVTRLALDQFHQSHQFSLRAHASHHPGLASWPADAMACLRFNVIRFNSIAGHSANASGPGSNIDTSSCVNAPGVPQRIASRSEKRPLFVRRRPTR